MDYSFEIYEVVRIKFGDLKCSFELSLLEL